MLRDTVPAFDAKDNAELATNPPATNDKSLC